MSLKTIVTTLYAQAHSPDCRTASLDLTGGLRIEVWKDDGEIFLRLSRADVYPSSVEWKTVLDCWPSAARADPVKGRVNHRLCLVGAVTPVQLSLPDG